MFGSWTFGSWTLVSLGLVVSRVCQDSSAESDPAPAQLQDRLQCGSPPETADTAEVWDREEPMRRWRLSKYPLFTRWLLQKFASWGPIVVFFAGGMLTIYNAWFCLETSFVCKNCLFCWWKITSQLWGQVNVGTIWPFCSRFMSPLRQCCLPNVDCTIVVNVIISLYLHGFQKLRCSSGWCCPQFLIVINTWISRLSQFASGGESFDDWAFATNCDFRTWKTWDRFASLRRNYLCWCRVAGSAAGSSE